MYCIMLSFIRFCLESSSTSKQSTARCCVSNSFLQKFSSFPENKCTTICCAFLSFRLRWRFHGRSPSWYGSLLLLGNTLTKISSGTSGNIARNSSNSFTCCGAKSPGFPSPRRTESLARFWTKCLSTSLISSSPSDSSTVGQPLSSWVSSTHPWGSSSSNLVPSQCTQYPISARIPRGTMVWTGVSDRSVLDHGNCLKVMVPCASST